MESIKTGNYRTKMYNIWNEKSVDGLIGRLGTAGEKINGCEYMTVESIQNESNRLKKSGQSLSECWNNIKKPNIWVIRVTEIEKRDIGKEKYLKT